MKRKYNIIISLIILVVGTLLISVGIKAGIKKNEVKKVDIERETAAPTSAPTEEMNSEYHFITFIDDDGYNTFYEKLVPIIRETGVSISTAIETGNVGTNDFMSWETIAACHEAGAEILNHSKNHIIGEDVKKYTDEEIKDQMLESIDDLTEHGYVDTADIYVYPGASAGYTWQIAKQVFRIGINASGNEVNTVPFNLFSMRRFAVGSDHTPDFTEMKNYIDQVSNINGWEIWMMHSHNGHMTDAYIEAFKEAIRYCDTVNVKIISVKEALDYFEIH